MDGERWDYMKIHIIALTKNMELKFEKVREKERENGYEVYIHFIHSFSIHFFEKPNINKSIPHLCCAKNSAIYLYKLLGRGPRAYTI